MNGLNKIILVALTIAVVEAQFHARTMNGNSNSRPRFGRPYDPSEQAASTQLPQQWNNNHRSGGQLHNIPSDIQQRQWNGNGNLQEQQQYKRQQNLVDYPFTVEYVDRRRQVPGGSGSMPTNRKGVGPSSMPQYDDDNLIDYPFTVEYVSNTNYPSENQENRAQASLHPNPDSFQFTTQQQRYQQNHHHHFSANHNNNGDPSQVGVSNPGSNRFDGNW